VTALSGLALWAWGIADATVRDHGTNVGRPWVALLALPSLALLVLAGASADLGGTARLLRRRLPVLLGTWSFALYLVHDELNLLVSEHGWLSADGKPGGVGDLVVFIACAMALAALAHYAIERPAERWLRGHQPGLGGAPGRLARRWHGWVTSGVPAAPGVTSGQLAFPGKPPRPTGASAPARSVATKTLLGLHGDAGRPATLRSWTVRESATSPSDLRR
jgi:peptidoglycan/LPS O-acetylase OafA/YrhL